MKYLMMICLLTFSILVSASDPNDVLITDGQFGSKIVLTKEVCYLNNNLNLAYFWIPDSKIYNKGCWTYYDNIIVIVWIFKQELIQEMYNIENFIVGKTI